MIFGYHGIYWESLRGGISGNKVPVSVRVIIANYHSNRGWARNRAARYKMEPRE